MKTHLTARLPDLDQTFPIQFSTEVSCSENGLQNTIEEAAAFVSRVYARFPLMNDEARSNLRKRGVSFNYLSHFPSPSECERFEIALK